MSNSSLADQSVSLAVQQPVKSERILLCSSQRHTDRSHLCGYNVTRLKTAKCVAPPAPRSASDPGLGGRVKWNLQRLVRNVNSG